MGLHKMSSSRFLKMILILFLMFHPGHSVENSQFFEDAEEMRGLLEKAKPYLTVKHPLFGFQIHELDPMTDVNSPPPAKLQTSFYDLTGVSWLATGSVQESLNLLGQWMVRLFLQEKNHKMKKYIFEDVVSCHVLRQNSRLYVAIMNPLYPSHLSCEMLFTVAQMVQPANKDISDLLQMFNGVKLKADKIHQAQEKLTETKQVLIEDIEKLIVRGDKIKDLDKKTAHLVVASGEFKKKAKKMNACCWLF